MAIRERLYKRKYRQWIDVFTSIDDELRRTNEILTALAEKMGAIVPPPAPPPEVVVEIPPPPAPPPVPLFPTGILEELVARMRGLAIFDSYISEEQLPRKGKVNSAQPAIINVPKQLGRTAKFGYIVADTGDINIRINDRHKIPVKAGEDLDIGKLHLEVYDLKIETDSTTDIEFRMVLV